MQATLPEPVGPGKALFGETFYDRVKGALKKGCYATFQTGVPFYQPWEITEALKELLGIGESMAGRLLLWDALAARFRTVKLRRDPHCTACGPDASLKDLSAHHATEEPACAV